MYTLVLVKTPPDPGPQVWTWSGKEPVHVVNHASSISMVFEKVSMLAIFDQ